MEQKMMHSRCWLDRRALRHVRFLPSPPSLRLELFLHYWTETEYLKSLLLMAQRESREHGRPSLTLHNGWSTYSKAATGKDRQNPQPYG